MKKMQDPDANMQKKSIVLVTGANGLFGASVICAIGQDGRYRARAMVRKGALLRSLEGLDYELFEGEITRKPDLEQALEGAEYVIHCAGRTAQYPSELKHYEAANIKSTRLLLQVARAKGIRRFVFVSTPNSFTNGTLENPGTEDSGFMPWLKKSGYAYSKYLAQQEVLGYVKKYDFPAVVVAPGFLIGPRDAKPSSGQLMLYVLKNRIVFCPPGGKSFVDAELAAQAVVSALTAGKKGDVWLLTGENMTYRQFFKILSQIAGKRKFIIPLPELLLRSTAFFFDLIEKIAGKSMPFNSTQQRLLCLDNYFDNTKAVKELNLQPANTEKTIKKAMNWFRENGYI